MTPAPIGYDKTYTVDVLNQHLAQDEAALGPLVDIDHDATQTLLTYDTDLPAPANASVIAVDGAGGPVVPVGSTLVKSGTIYIASALTDATATRPN